MTVSRLIARPMLASMFVVGGVNALRNAKAMGGAAAPVTGRLVPMIKKAAPQLPMPEDPVTLVRINGAAQLVAGLTLATGRAPRISSVVFAASLVPTTVAGHAFWEEQDPAARSAQRIHFFKNVSMLGGLVIAAGDTEGKPSLAWRAQKGGHQIAKKTSKASNELAKKAEGGCPISNAIRGNVAVTVTTKIAASA